METTDANEGSVIVCNIKFGPNFTLASHIGFDCSGVHESLNEEDL